MARLDKRALLRHAIFFGLAFIVIPALLELLPGKIFQFNLFSAIPYMAFLFALYFVWSKKKLKIKLNPIETILFCLLSFIAFLIHIYTKHFITLRSFVAFPGIYLMSSYLAFFAGIAFLALAVYGLEPFKKEYKLLIAAIVTAYIFFMFTTILWEFWPVLSGGVARLSATFLKLLGQPIRVLPNPPVLSLSGFSIVIGAPCSGIESIAMFTGLFALFIAYEARRLNKRRAALVYGAGLAGTYFLNALRISAIVLIGKSKPQLALELFHSHAGWVLFAAYVIGLAALTYRYMLRQGKQKQNLYKRAKQK